MDLQVVRNSAAGPYIQSPTVNFWSAIGLKAGDADRDLPTLAGPVPEHLPCSRRLLKLPYHPGLSSVRSFEVSPSGVGHVHEVNFMQILGAFSPVSSLFRLCSLDFSHCGDR